jgi:hypothetical protein
MKRLNRFLDLIGLTSQRLQGICIGLALAIVSDIIRVLVISAL